MWSFGCIIAELHSGIPLFPGESEKEQMSLLLEVLEKPSQEVIEMSPYASKFFDDLGRAFIMDDVKGERKYCGSKPLSEMVESENETFLDFI